MKKILCRVAWGLLLISVVPTFYELYKDVTTVFFNGLVPLVCERIQCRILSF